MTKVLNMNYSETVLMYLYGIELIHNGRFSHGNDDDPDYDLPIFNISPKPLNEDIVVKWDVKFKIYCDNCNEGFWTTLRKLLKIGEGCGSCPSKYQDGMHPKIGYGSKYRVSRTIELKQRFGKIDKYLDDNSKPIYDYCSFFYYTTNQKIRIWCNACKLWFYKSIHHFLNGHGCKYCSRKASHLRLRYTLKDVIEKATKLGLTTDYEYLDINYDSGQTVIIVRHMRCGSILRHTLSNHFSTDSSGCQLCGRNDMSIRMRNTLDDIERLAIEYNTCTEFNYLEVHHDNPGKRCHITIRHIRCGFVFKQYIWSHFGNELCPNCSNYNGGFSVHKPAIFYYIKFKIDGKWLYKIGVTNRTIKERFKREGNYIKGYIILLCKRYPSGTKALAREKMYKRLYTKYVYKGPRIMNSTLNTEIYTKDILEMDY